VNIENSDEVIEGLEFVLVELPKFVAETTTEKRMRVLWLRFLKEVGEEAYKIDPVLLADEHVKEAVDICEIGAYTPGELEAYERYWDAVSMDRTLRDNLEETTQALVETTQALEEKNQALEETTIALVETTQVLEEERIERKKATQALAEKDQALVEMTQAFAESQKLIESLQNK
jgi:hypothetical protein